MSWHSELKDRPNVRWVRELKRTEKQELKRKKREERQGNTNALNILFYGGDGWYGWLSDELKLNADYNVTHSGFDAGVPATTKHLDVIIVDAVKVGGRFPGNNLLDLIDDKEKGKICLSYKDGTDITELIKPEYKKFAYSEINEMKQYLFDLKEMKSNQ